MTEEKNNPLEEIIQPFIDLINAPRALMGINVAYFFEGLVYFGVLTVLGKYMSENVGMSDWEAGLMYGLFTAGITLAMLFLGGVGDRIGIRRALILALGLMVLGRLCLAGSSMTGLFTPEQGAGSAMHIVVALGLFLVVIGYGMYQPTSYAGIKKFTDAKTATMAYAVIYALMNFGAFFSGLLSPPIRQSLGIGAVFWVYVFLTLMAMMAIVFILTQRTEDETGRAMREAAAREKAAKEKAAKEKEKPEGEATPASAPEGEAEPEPAWTGKKVMLLTTAAVLAAGCTVGLLFSHSARARLPGEQAIGGVVDQNKAAVKVLGDVEEKLADPESEADPAEEMARLDKELAELVSRVSMAAGAMSSPGTFGGTLDNPARLILQDFLLGQEAYLEEARALCAQAVVFDSHAADASEEEKKAMENLRRALKDDLRAHAIFTMSLAYSMVADVDAEVVDRLQKRFKQAGEDIIPMSEALKAEAVSAAQREIRGKLSAYVAKTRGLAARITEKVPGGALAPLSLKLDRDADFAHSVGLIMRGPGSYAGSTEAELRADPGLADVESIRTEVSESNADEIITAKLLADAEFALKTGDSLHAAEAGEGFMEMLENAVSTVVEGIKGLFVDPEEEKAATPETNLTILVKTLKAYQAETEEMQNQLGTVFDMPFAQKFAHFIRVYGTWGVGILLFLSAGVMIFLRARPDHPFNNGRFVFFIFILIPVQTLFAHNWLTLPYYVNRSFGGTWVGDWFEFFTNINPLLIFVLAPLVAALTAKANVFRMMIVGTLVMASPTFLLALPPDPMLLLGYILIMSIGEAIWQPRFLQYVAELAPEGKTGIYMGIGQFPWFLTKMVTGFYSGYFLSTYIPKMGPQNPQSLWLIYAFIAMVSPVALMLTAKWIQGGAQKTAKAA